MIPMLFSETDRDQLFAAAQSDEYALSTKLDGKRLLCVMERTLNQEPTCTGFGRQGQIVALAPPLCRELTLAMPGVGQMIVDGELLFSGRYWVFDLVGAHYDGIHISAANSYKERQEALSTLHEVHWGKKVRLLEHATTTSGKLALLLGIMERHGEGVMARNLGAPYRLGERSSLDYKWKIIRTADCVVIGKGEAGKANLVLGCYDEANALQVVGRVSSLTGDGPFVNIGDVVQVNYTSFNKQLIQPTRPTIRKDKLAKDCLINQLVPINTHLLE